MKHSECESAESNRDEIAEILAKAVVRYLTSQPLEESSTNSPIVSHVGLSSSSNDRSL